MRYNSQDRIKYKFVFSVCLVMAASGFAPCRAQNIVGKWASVSTTGYLSTEAAKEMGKSQIVTASGPEAGTSTNEFRPDNTFTMSVTPGGVQEPIVMKGKWKLSGDQLQVTMDSPGNPSAFITVVVKGNTMVMSSKTAPPSKTTKVETTYKKVI